MMEFTLNDWGQRDIIKKTIILTKQVTDKINAVIPNKYHKYPSTTILKHANILDKADKSPYGSLHNMTLPDAYIITIHLHTMTIVDISNKQKE